MVPLNWNEVPKHRYDSSMTSLVTYELRGDVAVVVMDDGKANAMSSAMQADLHAALDRAEGEAHAVVLAGRPGKFSAGFNLGVLMGGGQPAVDMTGGGFELAHRVSRSPKPVVAACTGHAIAMGAFLLLSCDYRIGAEGEYQLCANEVAIGITMPHTAVEVVTHRLPAHIAERALLQSEVFSPANALATGWLDALAPAGEVIAAAVAHAGHLATSLNPDAHAATKARVRAAHLDALERAVAADRVDNESIFG